MDIGTWDLAVALLGGAAGKKLGDSPITGSKEWDKILGPAFAVASVFVYKKIGDGNTLTAEQASQAGLAIGGMAIGLWAAGKGAVKFVRSIFKKGLK